MKNNASKNTIFNKVGLSLEELAILTEKYKSKPKTDTEKRDLAEQARQEKLQKNVAYIESLKKAKKDAEELFNRIYELHLNGYRYSEISKELCIPPHRVSDILEKSDCKKVTITLSKEFYIKLFIRYKEITDIHSFCEKNGYKEHNIIALFARAKRLNWDVSRETLKKRRKLMKKTVVMVQCSTCKEWLVTNEKCVECLCGKTVSVPDDPFEKKENSSCSEVIFSDVDHVVSLLKSDSLYHTLSMQGIKGTSAGAELNKKLKGLSNE
jgi:hypothetical protein